MIQTDSGRLPRTRGGQPFLRLGTGSVPSYAPHARGSTLVEWARTPSAIVCPARAGVNRVTSLLSVYRLPRTRGGQPSTGVGVWPRFPCLPRVRGGQPMTGTPNRAQGKTSRNVRGSTAREARSEAGPGPPRTRGGRPAHAGMNRYRLPRGPRARGGIPPRATVVARREQGADEPQHHDRPQVDQHQQPRVAAPPRRAPIHLAEAYAAPSIQPQRRQARARRADVRRVTRQLRNAPAQPLEALQRGPGDRESVSQAIKAGPFAGRPPSSWGRAS